MGRLIDIPTLNIDFMMPRKASFDLRTGGIDFGRNGLGEAISVEMTGGGMVVAAYQDMNIHYPQQFRYLNWLGARLNGSHRFINVPMITDWMGPFPLDAAGAPQPTIDGITHDDGALFDDGSGYSQPTVYGQITEAAAVNAGIIRMRMVNLPEQMGAEESHWFSLPHPTKGWRAYKFWNIEDIDDTNPALPIYSLAITPPLRQAITGTEVTNGVEVDYVRPKCVMKLPINASIPLEPEEFWEQRPTIQFVEAW